MKKLKKMKKKDRHHPGIEEKKKKDRHHPGIIPGDEEKGQASSLVVTRKSKENDRHISSLVIRIPHIHVSASSGCCR